MILDSTIIKIAVLVYDFGIVAGTAYLVAIHNWSMWTFLLTALFFITTKSSKDEKKHL